MRLFAAIESGQVRAEVTPRDATRVRIQLHNPTNLAFALQLPPALAAIPSVASPPRADATAQVQILAIAGHNAFRAENGTEAVRPQLNTGSIYVIEANSTLKLNLPAVRLDYGPQPLPPRAAFRLVALESVTSEPMVEQVLVVLGNGQCTQAVAQLATWRVSEPTQWAQLSALTVTRGNGVFEPRFDRGELQQACRLVDAHHSKIRSRTAPSISTVTRK